MTNELTHNSKKFHAESVSIAKEPMIFESGRFAKQAQAAVWARWGDSVVLVTVCASDKPREGADFFPLTCEYIEKTYAAGKIPGGFLKRETKPKDAEILNARLIDRSIRPLFPEGFSHEVQVVATVVSHDGVHGTDMLALNAASMALHLSALPFSVENGPISAVRVGRIDGELVANPTIDQLKDSDIDIKVSSTKDAIIMVEGGASEISEAELVDILFFAQEEGKKVIHACETMQKELGKEKMPVLKEELDKTLYQKVEKLALKSGLKEALSEKEKLERYKALDEVKTKIVEAFLEEPEEVLAQAQNYFGKIKKDSLRKNVLSSKKRIDGRGYGEVRPICSEVGLLPRAHGSSVFTRGETQALVSVTLGTREDEQRLDGLTGESFLKFMLHYNFPPFCVGEARMLRGTSRREIGHGALAERALSYVLPSNDKDFPYSLRIVSEILESNGSSSMATVCGGTLALFDAGIKLKAPVAGIAMGMIKEGDDYAVLSDILGDEDHLGDMDFKVCGSHKGITAIQMDIKIDGLSREMLTGALMQAKEGREHILNEMSKALPDAREDISDIAPKIVNLQINPEKIRDLIGPGGRIIKDIASRTGAKIDVSDEGLIQVSGVGKGSVDKATKIVESLTKEAKINKVYKGFVKKITDFGAFIEIFPGTEGLCHVSELSERRVKDVGDVLQEGDEVPVAVISIERDGRVKLSRKKALDKEPGEFIS